MDIENGEALLHHLFQHGLLGKPGADLRAQMVVGRLQGHHAAMLPYHNMPVAGAGVKANAVGIELRTDGIHENVRILRGDFAGAVVQDGFLFVGLPLRQGYDVAAENHIVGLHGNAHAQSFQRRSS